MKKILFLLMVTAGVFVCNKADAQLTGIAINDDGTKADTSAILDLSVNVTSPKRGFLLPRMTTAQRDAIYRPAKALLIYVTNVDSLEINVGTPANPIWMALPNTQTDDWHTTGNSGTNSGANFLGTTDYASLSLRTNNVERMLIDSFGHVGIGSRSFDPTNPGKLLVDYGSTTSNTIANFKGSIDNYLQINVKNSSSGSNASSDIVATADNGTDTTFYIDMGINSSNYAPSTENFGGPNDGYLYTYSRNLLIGTAKPSTDIIFLLGGGVTKTNTAMRISAPSGNIIIGKGEGSNAPVGNILRGPNAGSTNISGGSLTIQGGSATGTGTGGDVNINGGSSASGAAGSVNINANANFATNINTGTSTSDVTIGGSNNNILLPKFTSVGNLIYTAANTGQIGSTSQLNWDNTNTRLGIGTSTPLDALHVAGNIRMVDGNQGAGKVMVSDANGTASWASSTSLPVTNSLSLSGNTLTSTVNGIAATSNAVSGVSNTSSANTLTTTVNGVTGTGVNIINSNALALSGSNLTSTVNGVASGSLDISSAVTSNAWSLTGNTGTTAGTNFIGTTDGKDFVTKTNNTERMRILSSGNVGIGTSTPSELLHLYGAAGVNAGVRISSNNGASNNILKVISGTGLQIQTGSATPMMTFDNTNLRAGIGTTTPGSTLDVKGIFRLSGSTSGYVGFQPAAAAGSTTYTLPAADGTAGQQLSTDGAGNLSWASVSSKAWSLLGNSGTNSGTNFLGTTDNVSLRFRTNNTERVVVDSTGNVGIGTSSPLYKLHVNATSNPLYLGGLQSGSSSDSVLTIVNGVVKQLSQADMMTSSTNAWALVGNTNAGTSNFVGTRNSNPLNFRTNNTQRAMFTTGGLFGIVDGISSATFDGTNPEKVLIDYGNTSSYNLIVAKGKINSYLQFNIQNQSGTGQASSDIVASADNATESVNFIDMGINSSNYNSNSGLTGGPNNAYLYATGNDFIIGNATSGKDLVFFTDGFTTAIERMRIQTGGNIGINTSTPTAKLDVSGNFKLGSSGTVLTNVIKTTGVLSSAVTVPIAGSINGTISVGSAAVGNTVIINPRSALPSGIAIAYAYVSAAGTITINFIGNYAVAASVPTTTTFDITLMQ